MKRSLGDATIILPTDQIIREFEPASNFLDRIDLPIKVLAEYLIDQWAQIECEPATKYSMGDMTPFEQILTYIVMDFLHGWDMAQLDKVDQENARTVIKVFCRRLYYQIIPILENFEMTHTQLRFLHVRGWLGHNVVLSTQPRCQHAQTSHPPHR